MGLHMSCDVEGCSSVEKVDSYHDVPDGWAKIEANRRITAEEFTEMRAAIEGEYKAGHVVQAPMRDTTAMPGALPVINNRYTVCGDHKLPKPKEGTGSVNNGLGGLIGVGRVG